MNNNEMECPKCDGYGYFLRLTLLSADFFDQSQRTCTACGGNGLVICELVF